MAGNILNSDKFAELTSATQFTILADTDHDIAIHKLRLVAEELPKASKGQNPVKHLLLEQPYQFQSVIDDYISTRDFDAFLSDYASAYGEYGYGEYTASSNNEAEKAFAEMLDSAAANSVKVSLIGPDRSGEFGDREGLSLQYAQGVNDHYAAQAATIAGDEHAIMFLGFGHLLAETDVDDDLDKALGEDRTVVVKLTSGYSGLLSLFTRDEAEITMNAETRAYEVSNANELADSISHGLSFMSSETTPNSRSK